MKYRSRYLITVFLLEAFRFSVFLLVWCAAGITAESFGWFDHPGWWMGYGYIVGTIGFTITDKIQHLTKKSLRRIKSEHTKRV